MDRGLLEDIKSVLKSLIISCPRGMTIEQLNKDYRNMEGRAIPFSQLGFSKLEPFLKSLTETLVVSGSGFDARVFAITSEKTAHIDNMISKQKNATRFRKIIPHRTSGNNYRPSPPPPSKPLLGNNLPMQKLNHQHSRISPLMHRQQQLHQSQFQQHQLQQHQLQQHQLLQQQQIYRYNTVNQNVCFNNVIHHPLLAQQQINTFKNIHYPILSPQLLPSFDQYQNVPLLNRLQNYNPNHNAPNNNQQLQQQNHKNRQHPQQQQHKYQQPSLQELRNLNEADNTNHKNGYSNAPPQFNQTNNSSIQSSSQLSDEQTKINLSNKWVGPVEEDYSDEEFIDFSDRDETIKTNNHSTKSNYDREDESFMNKPTLTHASSNYTGDNHLVNVSDDRVNDITASFRALDLNSSNGNKDLSYKMCEAIPELQQDDFIFQLDYPLNTVKFGEFIPESEIPMSIGETNWFGIFITEIHNPYKFWFHLYKENHELDILMQDIENTYTNLSASELQMTTSSIKPGQVCCALFMRMWHRAEILERPENDKVKVCFVDYGTVTSVELVYVKYLLSDFSSLRSQAIRGSLAQIRPVTHRWSRDATYAFLDMVSDLLLYAKATEINYEERLIQMVLTDTNKEVDFQINDALIRKGHARLYTPSVPIQSTSSESQILTMPRKHFQETYPTFDMLEKGEYPTFTEIGIYLSKGIDFEEIQDQNIIPDVDGGQSIDEITKKLTTPNTSRTEITEFEKISEEDFDGGGECNNDESKTDEIIVESFSTRDDENPNLRPLNSNNPFLNPQLLRSVLTSNHSETASPKLDRNDGRVKKENRDESDSINNFKFGTLNPFISESDNDQIETIATEWNNKNMSSPQILNHNPINLTSYHQRQPQLTLAVPLLLSTSPPPPSPQVSRQPLQQIYTQIHPIFMQNQQQQQIHQLPPPNQINYPSLNQNSFQNLHLFNFNPILNSNALTAAPATPTNLISNSVSSIRPPPGYEHVIPQTRNIFQSESTKNISYN